jgi:hypothetical protein
LCQPRVTVKMIVEKQMECRLAGETEVLGWNLPQRHFCPSQNPTWPDPGLNVWRSLKLFNDSVSYAVVIQRGMIWEDGSRSVSLKSLGRKRPWAVSRNCPKIWLENLSGTKKKALSRPVVDIPAESLRVSSSRYFVTWRYNWNIWFHRKNHGRIMLGTCSPMLTYCACCFLIFNSFLLKNINCLSICLSTYYLFIPVAPTWSIGHPWNPSFRFSFLTFDSP